jgi:hypothetical protein
MYFFSTPVRQQKNPDNSCFQHRSIMHLRGKTVLEM